ncbi:hypothetical protein F5I97DRAFT_1849078 [Phlebopus sp. FC_14]|nr:hypothetical protein F5I97DRAFT_1849078 [Phlebopus sp. FC_14]
MASYCSVESSMSSCDRLSLLHSGPNGTHKVHYNALGDWDFILDTQQPVDISFAIPHYRARHQPIDHRLSMFVGADASSVKLKVCRPVPRCKFYLEVQAGTSNVTIWLPSDFRGRIRHSGRATYSAGFINRMMGNVRLNEEAYAKWNGDEVLVQTGGAVTFRMWDVHTSAPEKLHKETLKRLFSCKKAPETRINWDFLLDD